MLHFNNPSLWLFYLVVLFIIYRLCKRHLIYLIAKRIFSGEKPDIFISCLSSVSLQKKQNLADIIIADLCHKLKTKEIYKVIVFKFTYAFLSECFVALPGKTIYIHSDFLESLELDEFQWVLAHEIGHCELGMACRSDEEHSLVDIYAARVMGPEAGLKVLKKIRERCKGSVEEEMDYRIKILENWLK